MGLHFNRFLNVRLINHIFYCLLVCNFGLYFRILGVLFVYFLVGSMYMRYVRQARGIEQLPHHEVWQAIGAKSAVNKLFKKLIYPWK